MKSIALLAGILSTFVLCPAAFAIHAEIPAETSAVVAAGATKITLSGDLRIRGWYLGSFGSFTGLAGKTIVAVPTRDSSQTYYDERVRLAVDASSGPVSGRIHLESNNDQHSSYRWGQSNKQPDDFNEKPIGISILEAWISYSGREFLGVPSGIKVGHMPLALGTATLFFDNTKFGDDAIAVYMDPASNTHLSFFTVKGAEESIATGHNGNDLDIYAGVFNGEYKGQQLGVYYAYMNQPGSPSKETIDLITTSGPISDLSLQDMGFFAKGKLYGVDYTAQADFQFGKDGGILTGESLDAEGYGLWLGLGYKIEPFNIRAMFAYGSGDSSSTGNDKQFITFLNPRTQYYSLVYDYNLAGATGVRTAGIADTTVFNFGIDITPVAKLKLSLDGYLLRANAANATILSKQFGKTVTSTSYDIGTEVDLKGAYQLTKELVYFANAGVLSTGDFYKDVLGPAADTDPWVLMHGLELAF